jgi:hypothetical protein
MNLTAGKAYGKVRGGALRRIASFAPAAVLSHWAFQSLFYMDVTERWFKLAIDLVLGVAAAYVFSLWLPLGAALALGFLAAHTINFLCNGHLWGVLKHYEALLPGAHKCRRFRRIRTHVPRARPTRVVTAQGDRLRQRVTAGVVALIRSGRASGTSPWPR